MKICYYIFLIVPYVYSFTEIKGEISNKFFHVSGSPFVVTETITIVGKKQVVIEPGCVFLFKPFTGINVYGSLTVLGTIDSPVVFTSFNDNFYNERSIRLPEMFDWNGVNFDFYAGKIEFNCFILSYSVFGIKSHTEYFKLNHGIFISNGQFNFTINDTIKEVLEGIPINYYREKILDNKKTRGSVNLMRNGAFVVSALSYISLGGFLISSNKSYASYLNAEEQGDMEKLKSNRDLKYKLAKTSGVMGTVFLVVGVGTAILDKTKKLEKQITFYPSLQENGFCININF
jgi:hypothetical protein